MIPSCKHFPLIEGEDNLRKLYRLDGKWVKWDDRFAKCPVCGTETKEG